MSLVTCDDADEKEPVVIATLPGSYKLRSQCELIAIHEEECLL